MPLIGMLNSMRWDWWADASFNCLDYSQLFVVNLSNISRMQRLVVSNTAEYQCQRFWQAWCLVYRQWAWAQSVWHTRHGGQEVTWYLSLQSWLVECVILLGKDLTAQSAHPVWELVVTTDTAECCDVGFQMTAGLCWKGELLLRLDTVAVQ
jgi:hypothetical protein